MTALYPIELARADAGELMIRWSDGQRRLYRVAELRDQCPCATCREKRSMPPAAPTALAILSPAETRPLALVEMTPVGSYAYNLRFSDGHDTGIYTFDFLRQLGREA